MSAPKVSVIMPVFNGMPYLPEAVDSVLNQTFLDFELIIINDCSTDSSTEYLKSLKDDRIVYLENSKNQGVTYTLQKGLKAASGQYIARLDSDDIADPDRFKIQVDFLENNSSYGLIGCSHRSINSNGQIVGKKEKFDDDLELRWKFLFKNPIVHSTVLFRQSLIKEFGFEYRLAHGEDYDLWQQMLRVTKACILKDVLLSYRVHNDSWTYTKKGAQVNARLQQSFSAINEMLQQNERDPLSWDSFLSFTEWKTKSNESDTIKNVSIELSLLECFSREFAGHRQLGALKRRTLKRIFLRSRKQILSRPSILFTLLKNFHK